MDDFRGWTSRWLLEIGSPSAAAKDGTNRIYIRHIRLSSDGLDGFRVIVAGIVCVTKPIDTDTNSDQCFTQSSMNFSISLSLSSSCKWYLINKRIIKLKA